MKNKHDKQLVKTVKKLFDFLIVNGFYPLSRSFLDNYWIFCSEFKKTVLQQSNKSASFWYQDDCTLTFKPFAESDSFDCDW